eukprot:TRINITY_DN41057_c0_g2_i3.p1 TRINITY_DN41057_c0_g2~~TRINITY_DN41057_c0_g2_i3.p1  ORF type:complete len:271 (-),score=42.85 TRINITY_DN41057_c0_g2_i3:150-962(-)
MLDASDETNIEKALIDTAPRPEETWALESPPRWYPSRTGDEKDSYTMSDPRCLRRHEPQRGRETFPDLVEVYAEAGQPPYGARPLPTCLQLGLLHRAVHVWLCDLRTGGLLLRKYCSSSVKSRGRWGPSAHTEVRCYDDKTGAAAAGGGPAAESSTAAVNRALREQLGVDEGSLGTQELWFTCVGREGNCCELLDVFVAPIKGGNLPQVALRPDERVQWVHFTDIFGSQGAMAHTLVPFEPTYRTSMVQRLTVRIVHADAIRSSMQTTWT